MEALVRQFPDQLQEAITIGGAASLAPPAADFNQILICGLGGSGIGGTIVGQLVSDESPVPVLSNKDYSIPAFVNDKTLVIICSYSGNTEETLEAFDKAMASNAQIACVTSGGKLEELANEHNLNHIIIPGGLPPRAAFGYAFAQLFFLLRHYGAISGDIGAKLTTANKKLIAAQEDIIRESRQLASALVGRIPVIYSDTHTEGVAIRWRQQINENSKMLCWHHVYPEMNHNELVGWTTPNELLAVIFLRNETDYARTQKRMEITKQTFAQLTPTMLEVYSKGDNAVERALYLIHLGDWVSVILAELKGIDPVEVNVITRLKEALARF